MAETDGPDVTTPGLLRAVRAEARQAERLRVRALLEVAEIDADSSARAYRPRNPGNTGYGRRAAGLRYARELLDQAGRTTYGGDAAGEPYASVTGACDSVELYEFDPADEVEDMPVRLVVVDGADNTMASAYLSLEDAEQTFRYGLALVELLRRRRSERAEAPS